MADHTHGPGEWMGSYRYMTMSMEGNRSGTDSLSTAQLAGLGYTVAPVDMRMEMHMIGMMYAPVRQVTLMAMLPIVSLNMNHLVVAGPAAGTTFKTSSTGQGDIRLGGMIPFFARGGHKLHFNALFSLPTASIGRQDVAFGPPGVLAQRHLPYPMQLGSGTVDVLPGVTYHGQADSLSWGAQVSGTVRLGRNHHGYSLGDGVEATTWVARRLHETTSLSFRMRALNWGNINGRDNGLPGIAPALIPTADPARRGGSRVDALFGVNFLMKEGIFKGHRLAIEGGLPVYQYLEGPQLETDWVLTVGWQFSW